MKRVALVVALGLPVFLSFNFVYRFGVDVPFWDQWGLVSLLQKSAEGSLSLGDLFAQHNEHRIFFPRIVMLLLAAATQWDIRAELWFSWLTIVAIGALLFVEHWKTFGSALSFVPCAWLVFTLRQEANFLSGWNLQITLSALGLCGAMALLSTSAGEPGRFAGAIACAWLSSFSFASGLAVWPAGVACLLCVPARRHRLGIWIAAGALTCGVYLVGYVKPSQHPSTGYALEHPIRAIQFFLMELGGPLAPELSVGIAATIGAALITILGVAVFRGRVEAGKASFGVALIAFAWITAAMVTVGRSGLLDQYQHMGAASRYTSLTLLGIVGIYRCCLTLSPGRLRTGALTAICGLIVLGTWLVLDTAYPLGTQVRRERMAMREGLLDWRNRSDDELLRNYPIAAVVRDQALVLERLHTGLFR